MIPIQTIKEVFERDHRVVFAYLYGSYMESSEQIEDLDIAVYASEDADPFRIAADLKIELHHHTGLSPDFFDIRIINDVLDKGDISVLPYMKNVFEYHALLADKDFDIRANFLEKYSMKYRECEGLLYEILR